MKKLLLISTLFLSGCLSNDGIVVYEKEANPDGSKRFAVGAAVKNRVSGQSGVVVQRIDDHAIQVVRSSEGKREVDRWWDVECEPVQ